MRLPLHIAKKLLQLLSSDESIASSSMQHAAVTKMLEDGLLQRQQISKTKAVLFITQKENSVAYLHNHFGISNLAEYITSVEAAEQSRAANVMVSGDSKLQAVRTFKGFLINSYQPVAAMLGGNAVMLYPAPGTYTYIHDYESFIPDQAVTIVGIENPENFRLIHQQQYLFSGIQPLFVSRYPQSNDLVKWLASVPNPYLHFGDLDFAGISIYQTEFKKMLGGKASFFLPPNTDELLVQYGNKQLFNKQYNPLIEYIVPNEEPAVKTLLQLLLKHKKTLEQEVFIKASS